MKEVFVDTVFWIAILNPNDNLHARSLTLLEELAHTPLITTQEVLTEVLNYYSKRGSHLRRLAVSLIQNLQIQPNIFIVKQSVDSFDAGLSLYAAREDKEYSATDCVSIEVMKKRGIREVLTSDEHFKQERFTILI